MRFKDLTVNAQAEAAGRELPSILNSYRNWIEVIPLAPPENHGHPGVNSGCGFVKDARHDLEGVEGHFPAQQGLLQTSGVMCSIM